MDNLTTPFLSINQGVPEGTVLGPVLLTIMVNDIGSTSEKALMIKYADDITCSLLVGNTESNTSCALTEVNNIKRWARDNQMALNLGVMKIRLEIATIKALFSKT